MESISRNLSTPFLTIVFNRVFCDGLFLPMRFDKKVLGRGAGYTVYCNEKFFAEFFRLAIEKILPLPGRPGVLRQSKMIAKAVFYSI